MAKEINYVDNLNQSKKISFINELDVSGYEFCSQDPILNLKWYGEEYSTLNASEASINIMIQNQEDHENFLELLENDWYVIIYNGATPIWYGKLMTDFFTESYQPYPYLVTLNASDQLGQFSENQPLMIDYNDPIEYQSAKYTVLDVVAKFLQDDQIKPYSGIISNVLNVSSRIYPTG